ncbi:fumarylacetoacetate hydrolase family protein [Lentzea sp. NBC_00516]|uniref:fumarylacetoacetate hydrolase family protein n=1 Tax=Lentzea sp. NBC_00516 TaxID=2903582 RepID=UPI002E822E8E|nr:fumarylacetoacetate hydrolase family protein [Lentzea sp. NBC_00516]WUD27470.1 fumarylacetoacetate hydrolase family protein [Lentzea sp. NBC_00516]
MRIATIAEGTARRPVLVDAERGVIPADVALPGFSGDAMALLDPFTWQTALTAAAQTDDALFLPANEVTFVAPYLSPRKIWGIGLNYVDHAGDLAESVPDEPASFIKGDHTIIGPGEPIVLPHQSTRVTAEAELGLVIGRYCRTVPESEALDHLWGVVPILDQTAEDVLRRNPRFLTRAKNFPTFFSFGPHLVPLDEIPFPLAQIEVQTVHNGSVHRHNTVSHMTFSPEFLVSFHSQVMPLFPGDIISTGTPGAVVVAGGDVVECRIPGIGSLSNPVVAEGEL